LPYEGRKASRIFQFQQEQRFANSSDRAQKILRRHWKMAWEGWPVRGYAKGWNVKFSGFAAGLKAAQ
jgi:hypothetical protein